MNALDALNQFPDCPILVVGDVMLDEFIWGQVSRISPEAPVPVVEVQRRSLIAGGAANTAANVASLGARAKIAGVVGQDNDGQRVIDLLLALGIETTAILRNSDKPTTTKTRVIAHSQQIVRIDNETPGWINTTTENDLLDRVIEELPRVRGCVISDYGKGVVTTSFMEQLIRHARNCRVPVIIDPKGTDYGKYRGATVVKPNQLEAGKVLNRELRTTEDVERAGQSLKEILGENSSVIITRGAQGMAVFEATKPVRHIPTLAREVYDVTGAGDTVAATLTVALACGQDLVGAAELASRAAAIVVGKIGTATCSLAELQGTLNSQES